MLAMDFNDDAGFREKRGAHYSIAGTPPGACSLLQCPYFRHKTCVRHRPLCASLLAMASSKTQ